MKRSLIVSLIVLLILLVFTLQNQEQLHRVNFLFWRVNSTIFMIFTMVTGVILGAVAVFPAVIKKNKRIDELKTQMEDFREKERRFVEENDGDTGNDD